MMQLQMFDPAATPVATQEMLDDGGLHEAIEFMRVRNDVADSGWPYVERICEIDGRPAWAIDDAGLRYVVARGLIFEMMDLPILTSKIRQAAIKAFERLDQFKN